MGLLHNGVQDRAKGNGEQEEETIARNLPVRSLHRQWMAHSLDYTMENAASSIKAIKEDEKVPEPLSDQVMEALMEVLPEYAKYYVAILVDTGLRTGELERIRWRDCKALGFLDTYLVFSPPPQRAGFGVCLGGPAPVFYSRAAARSTVHCRRA